jgi:transposase
MDYHKNVDHDLFFKWFKEKVCQPTKTPLTFVMDNAGYHKVKRVSDEEKAIFDGRTFSKLTKKKFQQYLHLHHIPWSPDLKRDELYDLARKTYEESPPAILYIARRHGHHILFLPPYHSDFNPIENIWGIVKGYVARNRKHFAMEEVERLTKEGVAHVTADMWERAIAKVEKMEDDLFVDDVIDEIH